jgi:hypothetical protein
VKRQNKKRAKRLPPLKVTIYTTHHTPHTTHQEGEGEGDRGRGIIE